MILVKTQVGEQVLKDRSVRLTPRERSAFILFNGERSVSDVLSAGMGVEQQDIDHLVQLGLLGPPGPSERAGRASDFAPIERARGYPLASEPQSLDPGLRPTQPGALPGTDAYSPMSRPAALPGAERQPAPSRPAVPPRSQQERYQQAYPIATRLTASLGLRGFRLNLMVEGATSYTQLVALAPKIRDAVGPREAAPLDRALGLI